MSAADFLRRCKYKNYLAKTFNVSCIFCKNSSFSSILATSYRDFHILCFVFVHFVLFSRANIQKMDETAIIQLVHYSSLIRLPNNQINKVVKKEKR